MRVPKKSTATYKKAYFFHPILPAHPIFSAFPIFPIFPAFSAFSIFPIFSLVPLVPPVPFLPLVPAFSALPYTNLQRTLSERSAKDERTITNISLFFLFVKILRFLQQKASKTDNLSIKDLLVASLLRFLQNNEYHKIMLNC